METTVINATEYRLSRMVDRRYYSVLRTMPSASVGRFIRVCISVPMEGARS